MDYRILGRTGLKVSAFGVGGGGPSRLGQRYEKSETDSVTIIREALDSGVNFIDTAETYGTEGIVGQAIKGLDRNLLVLSTKKSVKRETTPADVRAGLETSLRNLGVDYIDIYHLHGVIAEDYDYLLTEIVPVLQSLQQAGKIGYIGITERFHADPQHVMLQRALQDDVWDVMMVGFNILNQSARERVFSQTVQRDIGVLVMFAVRAAFSKPERLREMLDSLIAEGRVDRAALDQGDPLGFVLGEDGAVSLADAAYRFCLYEPGTHVILSGTGNPEHLRENLQSFERAPLPPATVERLQTIFQQVDNVSGQ